MQLTLTLLLLLSLAALPLSLWGQFKALSRNHDRELVRKDQVIKELNDRLMYLVGRAWDTPLRPPTLETEEDKEEIDTEWKEV